MPTKKHLLISDPTMAMATTKLPVSLYDSQQLYAMEQAWFAQGYDSFALMQQAAWQMTQHIIQLEAQHYQQLVTAALRQEYLYAVADRTPSAIIWVGHGNNGGDGWLVAYYLQQAGWQVTVLTVAIDDLSHNCNEEQDGDKASKNEPMPDAIKAQQLALRAAVPCLRFEDPQANAMAFASNLSADVFVDALFGIGLNRSPSGIYKQAIECFNKAAKQHHNYGEALVVAVDIPSGLVATTGQVFERLAIETDVTLCLIARKFGLHTKDGMDYAGVIIDIPLIPYGKLTAAATLLSTAQRLSARRQNSYKGSYGHVLVIGGNQIEGSQGMGGAAILASASAMATGAGKITVACHTAFHGALLTSLPDAMTIDLHDIAGVKSLIKEASVVAIGMGLGRDKSAENLLAHYLQAVMQQDHAIVIDADGLYHLASLHKQGHKIIAQLKHYSVTHQVCLTPHSGEAARLLDKDIIAIEDDRLAAIKQCAATYGGDWVLKGAGSLVLEKGLGQVSETQSQVYVCAAGNAGMASAGMGDVLSGVSAGLLAQQDLSAEQHSLRQAVLIHGLAADLLMNQLSDKGDNSFSCTANLDRRPLIGQRGLQAQDMPAAVRQVIALISL